MFGTAFSVGAVLAEFAERVESAETQTALSEAAK
jgi:hypothetical protein